MLRPNLVVKKVYVNLWRVVEKHLRFSMLLSRYPHEPGCAKLGCSGILLFWVDFLRSIKSKIYVFVLEVVRSDLGHFT